MAQCADCQFSYLYVHQCLSMCTSACQCAPVLVNFRGSMWLNVHLVNVRGSILFLIPKTRDEPSPHLTHLSSSTMQQLRAAAAPAPSPAAAAAAPSPAPSPAAAASLQHHHQQRLQHHHDFPRLQQLNILHDKALAGDFDCVLNMLQKFPGLINEQALNRSGQRRWPVLHQAIQAMHKPQNKLFYAVSQIGPRYKIVCFGPGPKTNYFIPRRATVLQGASYSAVLQGASCVLHQAIQAMQKPQNKVFYAVGQIGPWYKIVSFGPGPKTNYFIPVRATVLQGASYSAVLQGAS